VDPSSANWWSETPNWRVRFLTLSTSFPVLPKRPSEGDWRKGCRDRRHNFYKPLPAADVYPLKFILHDWDDRSCTTRSKTSAGQ
jgi:O-methyltransferase domain